MEPLLFEHGNMKKMGELNEMRQVSGSFYGFKYGRLW